MKPLGIKKDSAVMRNVRHVVIGSVLGGLLCAFLLTLFSFGFVKAQHLPQFALMPVVIFVSAASAFFAGYVTVRLVGKNGLAFGALTGFVLFLLFFLAGFLLAREAVALTTLTRLAIMALSGAIGGYVAVSRKKR